MDLIKTSDSSKDPQQKSFVALDDRVQGLEHEYAIEFKEIDDKEERDQYIVQKVLDMQGMPAFGVNGNPARHTFNGGKVYIDLNHLEGCTPEVKSTEELLKYDRALDLLVLDIIGSKYGPRIYRMSRDSHETFGGMHRNIMTRLAPTEKDREQLLLWAVVEKVITGSGYQYPDGQYEILQRRTFIKEALSNATMDQTVNEQGALVPAGRPILNLRTERLCEIPGWHRFHDIADDATMDQSTLAMGQELWKCVLLLAENNLLPNIQYYQGNVAKKAVEDLYHICERHSNWTLEGTPPEFRSLVSVLEAYHESIKGELRGQNPFRDRVIDMFGETIPLLADIEKHPYALAGRIGWITKKYLLERFMGDTSLGPESREVQDNNIDYHRIDPEGLFYQAVAHGWIEQWASDKEAVEVINEPPRTRAYIRGVIAQIVTCSRKENLLIDSDWGKITVSNGDSKWSKKFPDPRLTYEGEIPNFKLFLNKCGGNHFSQGRSFTLRY